VEATDAIEAMESRESCDAIVVTTWKNRPAAIVEKVRPALSERIEEIVRSFTPA
jgi:hypothetical protein